MTTMGLYIETDAPFGKAEWIRENWPAVELWDPTNPWSAVPEDRVPVCVVRNAGFEAAAVAYNEDEYDEFRDTTHDKRPRRWLTVLKADAKKLPGAQYYFVDAHKAE